MAGPQITIDLGRIERNARTIATRCARSGISVFGVTKGTCGMPQVARAMLRGGVKGIAESRFENIDRLRNSGIDCPIMLLRSPPLSRAEDVVRKIDISLQSELAAIHEVSRVAERLGRVHDIILMIDLGDLREGVWPTDLLKTVEAVMRFGGVRIAGVGTNLSCFGAIMPSVDNLGQLVAHAYKVERITGRHLEWISGGNSSSLPLLLAGGIPAGINNLRIGEAILQGGRDTFHETPWEELERDAFSLTAELIEVKIKPSLPIGRTGLDAFGQKPEFLDEGDMLRGIANLGREDVIVEGLTPQNPGIHVLGASSDHLVVDLTDASPALKVGDRIGFSLNYGAMLMAMTSEYVEKIPVHPGEAVPRPKRIRVSMDKHAVAAVDAPALDERLQSIGFECVTAKEAEAIELTLGAGHGSALDALAGIGGEDAAGLIWFDYRPALAGAERTLACVLERLKPRISPENVVLVGLREAVAEEAAIIKSLHIKAFTMVDIDARGIRDVMREAIKAAGAGTTGYHVSYAPETTDMRNWPEGTGGLTVRESHQAMESIAAHGGMRSLSVSSLSASQSPWVVETVLQVILSALGKTIL